MSKTTGKNKNTKKKKKKETPLTMKMELFCEKVVEGKSLSDAYRFAYSTSRMKVETVHRKASELASHGKVTARLDELKGAVLDKHETTVERILHELMKIAFFNPKGLYDENGDQIPVHLLPDDVATVIGGISPTVGKTILGKKDEKGIYEVIKNIKLIDKTKSLELLGRYLAMFTDKVMDLTPREQIETDYKEKKREEARELLQEHQGDNESLPN